MRRSSTRRDRNRAGKSSLGRTFDWDAKLGAVVKDVEEVLLVDLGAQQRVAVHALSHGLEVVEILGVQRLGRLGKVEVLVLRAGENGGECECKREMR